MFETSDPPQRYVTNEMARLVQRLRIARVPLKLIWREARVHHTTWYRWANGTMDPSVTQFLLARRAVDRLCDEYERKVLEQRTAKSEDE